VLWCGVCVALNFGFLAMETLAAPGGDIFGETWPNITCRHEPACGTCSRMGEVMHVVENREAKLLGNKWAEGTSGNVSMEGKVVDCVGGWVESGVVEELLSRRTRGLELG